MLYNKDNGASNGNYYLGFRVWGSRFPKSVSLSVACMLQGDELIDEELEQGRETTSKINK